MVQKRKKKMGRSDKMAEKQEVEFASVHRNNENISTSGMNHTEQLLSTNRRRQMHKKIRKSSHNWVGQKKKKESEWGLCPGGSFIFLISCNPQEILVRERYSYSHSTDKGMGYYQANHLSQVTEREGGLPNQYFLVQDSCSSSTPF